MAVALQPGGRLLASGDTYGKLRFWDTQDGRLLGMLNAHRLSLSSLAFRPDGRRLVSSSSPTLTGQTGGELILWDSTVTPPRPIWRHALPRVHEATFSPDGKLLAVACGDQTTASVGGCDVLILDARNGRVIHRLRRHRDEVLTVTFHPDGRLLASAGKDRVIRLWDVATGHLVQTLEGHMEEVHGLAFSPDGHRLASAGFDKLVKLWNVATGEELLSLRGHDNGIVALAFSPDGHHLVSGSADRSLRIWSD